MQPQQFLKTFYKIEKDVMFDEMTEMDTGILVCSSLDDHPFWSNVQVDHEITDEQLTACEELLIQRNRKPAFYYLNSPKLATFTKTLIKRGYTQKGEDAWMFYEKDLTATLYCVYQSIKKGNTMHAIATEEGTSPTNFINTSDLLLNLPRSV